MDQGSKCSTSSENGIFETNFSKKSESSRQKCSYKIDCYQITLDRRVNRGHNCFMVKARSSVYFIWTNRTDLLDVSRGLCSEVCTKVYEYGTFTKS